MVATDQAKRQSQLRAIAEVERLLPLLFVQLLEFSEVRRRKAQRGEDCARIDGNL
jgi:hypothetical protein